MEILQEFTFLTLLYFLVCCCIIYPPIEFVAAGITIESIFASYLKSESEQFISYHLRRSSLNLFVYSVLPLTYVILLSFFGYYDEIASLFILFWFFAGSTLVFPLLALYQIKNWSRDNWRDHPIVENITKFCNNDSDWSSVAARINNEFRRVDKICIRTNAIAKIIATENWILKVTPLTIFVVHQSDATLQVSQSDTHTMSIDNLGQVQYVNIQVKSARANVKPFMIRLNAVDFKDLSDRVARIITVLPNVKFHKTLLDKFIDAFKNVVEENARFECNEELESCIGCMQTQANVKLQKLCLEGEGLSEPCLACHCKPMWCIDCMAKWFASRQNALPIDTWLSAKCTCPMCRSTFCMLDISLVQT